MIFNTKMVLRESLLTENRLPRRRVTRSRLYSLQGVSGTLR
jgi:hypothetical protein